MYCFYYYNSRCDCDLNEHNTLRVTDVGVVRLRYPIYPVHGEGNPVWKELNALKHIVEGKIGVSARTITFWVRFF